MGLARTLVYFFFMRLVLCKDDRKIDLGQQTHLFQGDLKLSAKTRNAILSPGRKWPNGVIPYEIRSSYSASDRQIIHGAMRRIEQVSCIKFIPRAGHKDYVFIQNTGDGCYTSNVGYQRGPTEMSLQSTSGPDCMHHSIVVHELLHAVGLWHEHTRFDRDKFVKINYKNVQPGMESQFTMVRSQESSTYGVAYDYNSVMHYSKSTFSIGRNRITIEPLQSQYLNVIGKTKDISQSDILKVNRMYNCKGSSAEPTGSSPLPPTRPPPLLPLPPQPLPIPAKPSGCQDLSPNCDFYVKAGYCETWDVMETHCKASCKLC